MEDNAPIHTSRCSQRWKEKHGIESIVWPPQSPDLSPLENLWHKLKVAIEEREARRLGRDGFIEIVMEVWDALRKDKKFLEDLIQSMPKRMRLVVESKGMPIGY